MLYQVGYFTAYSPQNYIPRVYFIHFLLCIFYFMSMKFQNINPYLVSNTLSKVIVFIAGPIILLTIGQEMYGELFYFLVKVNVIFVLVTTGFIHGFFKLYFDDKIGLEVLKTTSSYVFFFATIILLILQFFEIISYFEIVVILVRSIGQYFYSYLYVLLKEKTYSILFIMEYLILYIGVIAIDITSFESTDFYLLYIAANILPFIGGLSIVKFGVLDRDKIKYIYKYLFSILPYNISSYIIDFILRSFFKFDSNLLSLSNYTILLQSSSVFGILIGSLRQRVVPKVFKQWKSYKQPFITQSLRKLFLKIIFLIPPAILCSIILIKYYFKIDFEWMFEAVLLVTIAMVFQEFSIWAQLVYEFYNRMLIYSLVSISIMILIPVLINFSFENYTLILAAFVLFTVNLVLMFSTLLLYRLWRKIFV